MTNVKLQVEYLTDLGKHGEVCVLFAPPTNTNNLAKPGAKTQELSGAQLARYFGEGTAQLLAYAEDPSVRPVLLRAAKTLLASQQLRLIYSAAEPVFFMITREAYNQALGFDPDLKGGAAFREFFERAQKL